MSDIVNHYHFGRDIFNRLADNSSLRNNLSRHYALFALGTQGPDFFYYQNPLKGSFPLPRLGSLIHQRQIDAFFLYGFRYAATRPNKAEGEMITAYLMGFALHHELDVATHPFIFYRTGSYKALGQRKYAYFHKTYEVLLDVAFSQYEYKELACFFDFHDLFKLEDEAGEALDRFYQFIARLLYGVTLQPGEVRQALRFATNLAIFYGDPQDIKKKLLRPVEQVLGEAGAVSRIFYPLYANEFTVLNLGRETHRHPCTGKASDATYPELFRAALDTGEERLGTLAGMIRKGNINPQTIHSIFENRRYDTGIPAGSRLTMKYFDPLIDHPVDLW